jgi:ComF family protein
VLRGPLIDAGDALLAALLAPRCAACSNPLERPTSGPVCDACWTAVAFLKPPLCRICGSTLASWRTLDMAASLCPLCRRRPGAVDAARSVGPYEGALRDIVHAFKYEARRTLAPRLGAMMREAGGDLLAEAACIVPVPLHRWRRFRRGFNQSADLARSLGLPVVHALWRLRATVPQTGLTAAGRRRNVRGAFATSPLLSRRVRRTLIAGRVVVLVDDVRTTGATLDACARVLKAADAAEVRTLTVARADHAVRPRRSFHAM